jgi:hypothetical protein
MKEAKRPRGRGKSAPAPASPAPGAAAPPAKQPFDIDVAVRRLREAVRPSPKAALFELAEEGHGSVFELLAACIISIRTRDETTLPAARRLFARARTPAEVERLTPQEIDCLIGACTFHEPKARQIHAIARRAVAEHGGTLPCDLDVLLSLTFLYITARMTCVGPWGPNPAAEDTGHEASEADRRRTTPLARRFFLRPVQSQ